MSLRKLLLCVCAAWMLTQCQLQAEDEEICLTYPQNGQQGYGTVNPQQGYGTASPQQGNYGSANAYQGNYGSTNTQQAQPQGSNYGSANRAPQGYQQQQPNTGAMQNRQPGGAVGYQQQRGKVQWYTNYTQALSVAQRENKPLLLFFTGSDWCGWCKKIDKEVFDTQEFGQSVGGRFVFVKLDFPMNNQLPREEAQQNAMLKQKYGVTGFPTIVVLDSQENFLAETGYRPGGGQAYADYLSSLIKSNQ